MAEPGAEAEASLALTYVRSVFERHGVPKYRQSAALATAFGLSYSQAHRRLNGTSPWSLEDLVQLASLFGETLADVVAAHDRTSAINAVLRTGSETINCRIWIGEAVSTPKSGAVFAVKAKTGWVVATIEDAFAGDAYAITRLEAHPASDRQRRVAVLDDDVDLTDSIVSNFESLGFSARPFYNAADLLAAATRFDCFVLDWVVGEATVLDVVRSLRTAHATCPIVILTAQVATGVIDETDIAVAMQRYDLLFCEKPVRAPILAAMLSRAFSSRRDPTIAAARP